jgi:glycosyltransferase XagB
MAKLDILIPAKNEAGNLPTLLERISRICAKAKIDYRAIVVDDHSTDNSLEVLKKLKHKYPLEILTKKDKPGKAFSILEAAEIATTEYVLMIDTDLQYPPEAIPEMMTLTPSHGVIVAERSTQKTSFIRQLFSKANRYLLGKFILGIDCDAQSGMKLFRRSILTHLDSKEVDAWAIDMPILHTALELGLTIGCVNIEFVERSNGHSKVSLFKTTQEILTRALKLKFKPRKVYHLPSTSPDNMIGAGVIHKRRQFITHTHLHHDHSAIITLHRWQKIFLLATLGIFLLGFVLNATETAIIFVALLTFIYFLDVFFNLFLVLKSLHFPPEINFSPEDLAEIDPKTLPVYSILCPLYREAKVLPAFVESINNFDYPKDKLDVLLLLEEDDTATIEAAKELKLPKHFRTIIVPHSQPKTKPKACNYGLSLVKGEYVVIYDAEDRPDPDQLKKAYLGFQNSLPNIACLQAKLNYYNPRHNLLTRLFTAEYSLWFDITLPGLQSISTTIPLGGTSNHFRTQILKDLHGWDSFNVTEDCDLGARLFKLGFQTAIIESITLEEANSHLGNWIRQRSRWIKGYMQTYLVHNRHPLKFIRSHGIHAFIFQLIVGGKIAFMLINPILWLMTLSYFLLYRFVGPTIETLYPQAIFYMAVFSIIFGNFLFLYYYMIGCAKRGHYELIKYVFLIPFYWIAISVAATKALYQLIVKPHFWEKTHHGLHFKPETTTNMVKTEYFARIKSLSKSNLFSSGSLIVATVIANFFNFLYNAYLGRVLSYENFGLISLIGSFIYISQLPIGSLSKTIVYRSAYLFGKYQTAIKDHWHYFRRRALYISLIATGLWLIFTPFLSNFFHTPSLLPFLFFAPLWLITTVGAVDSGFLVGNLRFTIIALIIVIETILKFILTVFFVSLGLADYVYATLPISAAVAFFIGWHAAKRLKQREVDIDKRVITYFPRRFFATSFLVLISTITFLSLDVILVKHFLTPQEAGSYALLALTGKMVFFAGSLFSQFITPLISHEEGIGKNSNKTFYRILTATILSSLIGFIIIGIFGHITVPILFGEKSISIISFLPMYTLAMVCFSASITIVNYHQALKHYTFPLISLFFAIIQIIGITLFHQDLRTVILIMTILGPTYLLSTIIIHANYPWFEILQNNSIDFLGLFISPKTKEKSPEGKIKILIFNWYDTKHVWGGGAEIYLHNIAKYFIKNGHQVTIFCGNDRHSSRFEIIDGILIYRRGGLYTVAIWAFVYYWFKFRNKFDVIIDSAKGVPFFTPLYVREPIIGLICHVHQEMFRTHLKFPLKEFSMFLEAKLMPFVYKNNGMVTISNSSRLAMEKMGFGKNKTIEIITPGVDIKKTNNQKTKNPSLLYLGRLRRYKCVDTIIFALNIVKKTYPNIHLTIAGSGEDQERLKKIVRQLDLSSSISFTGKVSEKEKARLFTKSWISVQPSLVEGWGITNIEANACGTAVIASSVEGLKDSVIDGKTGILFTVKDNQALAKEIKNLIKNRKLREKLSENGIIWSKNFSWQAGGEKFQDIIYYQLHINNDNIKNTHDDYCQDPAFAEQHLQS